MEPKAHHLVIGVFTLIAVVAALLFALWLAKSSADREWAYYEIVFDHAVGGLSKGNPVLYSGVEVGDVLDLQLDFDNPGHVRVLVRVEQSVPVRKDTRAGLVLANITGSMSVQFSGGSKDSPILEGTREKTSDDYRRAFGVQQSPDQRRSATDQSRKVAHQCQQSAFSGKQRKLDCDFAKHPGSKRLSAWETRATGRSARAHG